MTAQWTFGSVGSGTFTVPTGITVADSLVAGGHGGHSAYAQGGNGIILADRLSVTAGGTLTATLSNGNVGDPNGTQYGGGSATLGSTIAGGGGGAGYPAAGGDAGLPGADALDGQTAVVDGLSSVGGGQGGRSAGTPGTGGVGPASYSTKANGNPGVAGTGGVGAHPVGYTNYSGAGGSGYGGGGSGAVLYFGTGLPGYREMYAGGGGGGSSKGGTFSGWNFGLPYVILTYASTPFIPSTLAPIGGVVQDREDVIRLVFKHNGASSSDLDAITRYDIQWRVPGAGSWTDVNGVTAVEYHDFAANVFPAGVIEWRVRTYADGIASPYSPVATFLAAPRAAAPVIVTPAASAVMVGARVDIAWTAAAQDQYQARIVGAVGGGAMDDTIVYYDSGVTVSALGEHVARLARDQITAYVQVSVRTATTAWSLYDSVKITTDWVLPPVPRGAVAVDPGTGSMTLNVINDSPSSPLLDHTDVYVIEGGVESARPVTSVEPNGSYTYRIPRSDVPTGFRLVAVVGLSDAESTSEVIY